MSYLPGKVQPLAIDVWDGNEPLVNIFATNSGVSHPILMYGGQAGILSDYNCSYDYFFIIGGDGIIKWRGNWNQTAMTAALDAAVAELDVADIPEVQAGGHRLLPNYPNPFNPATRIPYELAPGDRPVAVRLEILDLRGRVVRTLVDHEQAAGARHEANWNGTDNQGRRLPSGPYLARLQAGGIAATRLVTLVK